VTRSRTFAPTIRYILDCREQADLDPGAARVGREARGELRRLDALVREVLRHEAGNTTRPTGQRPCSCTGPRECMRRIVERAGLLAPATPDNDAKRRE
jgi:hypothetical protein